VAYVSQQAWVQQGTLRDNVCFGKTYDERRFSKVVYACALTHDLDQLKGRDMAELGGKVLANNFSDIECCHLANGSDFS